MKIKTSSSALCQDLYRVCLQQIDVSPGLEAGCGSEAVPRSCKAPVCPQSDRGSGETASASGGEKRNNSTSGPSAA